LLRFLHGWKPQDVQFTLQLESQHLDFICPLNKLKFQNHAVCSAFRTGSKDDLF